MHGVAVRAVAGRRDDYRPVVSRLCTSPDPLTIAAAYRDRYGIEALYLADLDAILGRGSNAHVAAALAAAGFRVALDPGLRCTDGARRHLDLGIATIVAALETLPGPDVLSDLIDQIGPDRLAFGLDLAGGVPLAAPAAWGETTWPPDAPLRLARRAAEAGIERLILLDLRAVGTAAGPVTADLCREIKSALSRLRLWTGGGVRTLADVRCLTAAGADAVLVASALHDDTLEPATPARVN
jgi:phosphoribosylformimino-5-aminoimidazole carboxamide ribotide isomerase